MIAHISKRLLERQQGNADASAYSAGLAGLQPPVPPSYT